MDPAKEAISSLPDILFMKCFGYETYNIAGSLACSCFIVGTSLEDVIQFVELLNLPIIVCTIVEGDHKVLGGGAIMSIVLHLVEI